MLLNEIITSENHII